MCKTCFGGAPPIDKIRTLNDTLKDMYSEALRLADSNISQEETFMPKFLFYGVLPEALLERYDFWQVSE